MLISAEIGPSGIDRGYFGPWQMCKQAYYGRTKCGDSISRFHPVGKSCVDFKHLFFTSNENLTIKKKLPILMYSCDIFC